MGHIHHWDRGRKERRGGGKGSCHWGEGGARGARGGVSGGGVERSGADRLGSARIGAERSGACVRARVDKRGTAEGSQRRLQAAPEDFLRQGARGGGGGEE